MKPAAVRWVLEQAPNEGVTRRTIMVVIDRPKLKVKFVKDELFVLSESQLTDMAFHVIDRIAQSRPVSSKESGTLTQPIYTGSKLVNLGPERGTG